MSPVQKGIDGRTVAASAVMLIGVLVALGMAWFLLSRGSIGEPGASLGPPTFNAGQSERMSELVADDGPVGYGPVNGSRRAIWLQHIGDDPDEGWVAIDAHPIGTERDCLVQWSKESEDFGDECIDERFAADGTGLDRYYTVVDDGDVVVDFRIELDEDGNPVDPEGILDDGADDGPEVPIVGNVDDISPDENSE